MGVKEADTPYCANYERLVEIVHELGREYKLDNWMKSAELMNFLTCFLKMLIMQEKPVG